MRRLVTLVLVMLVSAALPAGAQSLFSTRGLGVPVEAVDARARALGGIGVGLLGPNASLVSPASIAGVIGRGVAAGMQPTANSVAFDGEEGSFGGTRFPLIHVLYPVGSRVVAGLGYGGFLDQQWGVTSEGAEILGADTVAVRDRVEADGGISELRFSVAYRVAASLAVGAAAGMYTGRVDRVVERTFPDSAQSDLSPFRTRIQRTFTGPTAGVGVRWDPARVLRLGGTVSWSGRLDADAESTSLEDQSIDMPWRAAAGASARLRPRLLATLGARWAGWGALGLGEPGSGSQDEAVDAWTVGGGFEWDGPRMGRRDLPVRLGFHYGTFPFKLEGETPKEWAVAFGAGLRLAGDPAQPAAVADAAIERGRRAGEGATGLTEDFWRFTLSLALFGL